MCEYEEIVERIRGKYNLAESHQGVTNFVDNLAVQAEHFEKRSSVFEKVVNDIRAILKLEHGDSIIDAVKELKREREPRYEDRVLDHVRMMQWLVGHGYTVDDGGNWVGNSFPIVPEMWRHCSKPPSARWSWHPEWIEKVEAK